MFFVGNLAQNAQFFHKGMESYMFREETFKIWAKWARLPTFFKEKVI